MNVQSFFKELSIARGVSLRSLARIVGRHPTTLLRAGASVRVATAERWATALQLTQAEREKLFAMVRTERPSPWLALTLSQARGWTIDQVAMHTGLSPYVAACWLRGTRRSSGQAYMPAPACDARIREVFGPAVMSTRAVWDSALCAEYWRETRGTMPAVLWSSKRAKFLADAAACEAAELQEATND